MRRSTYIDDMGVERHALSGRKVRKDKGTTRPHPPTCAHCRMVDEYRQERNRQLESQGGWRNETAQAITFREWLVMYYRELRAREEAA